MQTFIISLVLGFTACQTVPHTDTIKPHVLESLKLAHIRLNEGRAADALDAIRPLRPSHSKDINVLRISGLIHLALDNPQRAHLQFQRAYTLRPSAENALNLSSALIASQQYQKVRSVLTPHLHDQDYIHKERLYHNLGTAAQEQGKISEAQHWYQQALSEYPIFYLSLLQLGRMKLSQRRTDEGAAFLERAIASCPSCFAPVYELVHSYKRQRQYSKAITTLRQHLKVKDITHPKDAHSLLRSLTKLASQAQNSKKRIL